VTGAMLMEAHDLEVGGRLWMPHKMFDIASAEASGPTDGNAIYLCPGDLFFDPEALEAGDPWVVVRCDHCPYEVGVPRATIEATPEPPAVEPFWWQR
jgi:hypothetical protein